MVVSPVVIMTILMVVMVVGMTVVYATRYTQVPPNRAMVVKRGTWGDYFFVIGGGLFVPPGAKRPEYLSLDVRMVRVELGDLKTASHGAQRRATIDAVLVYKITSDKETLKRAVEGLIGRSDEEIDKLARDIVEEGLRRLFKEVEFEAIDPDPDTMAQNVVETFAHDLMNVGLEIKSFQFHDIQLVGDGGGA